MILTLLCNKYISDFRAFFRLYHQIHHCQSTIATMSIRPYLKWNVIMLLFGYTPYPGCWLIITKITICLVKGSGTKSSFATGILRGGLDPSYYVILVSQRGNFHKKRPHLFCQFPSYHIGCPARFSPACAICWGSIGSFTTKMLRWSLV